MTSTAASHPSEASLPTLNKLGVSDIPADLDVTKIASEWFASFSEKLVSGDVEGVLDLLIQSSFDSAIPETHNQVSVYWRDLLALTWDFRTFEGTARIRKFLDDRLQDAKISNIQLKTANDADGLAPSFTQPFPDLAWIMGMFTFETAIGLGSGVFRLVPTQDEQQAIRWKGHTILTNLEDLKGYPEKIGPLREHQPNHGKWEQLREKESRFEDGDPAVLIIGGGQSGLEVAARLKSLGVSALIIEKHPRIGDNWRNRYDALCLHDPVWYDHMPYIPFPPNFPVFIPAKKLANWLEFYAKAMEINTWLSSTVKKIERNKSTGLWKVTVENNDIKQERIFNVKHVIFASGFGGDTYNMPSLPGMDKFKGQILHSSQHKRSSDHAGKKVVLIGSGTSAHDIAVDCYDNGVDVTMYQRGSTYVMSVSNGMKILFAGLFFIRPGLYDESAPPVGIADRVNASTPSLFGLGINYRLTQIIADADREILDGLRKVGFKLNTGYKDAGAIGLAFTKAGGYYLDVGASQYIIDGKIKLKSDSVLETFTETGLKFADGTEILADVVIFCTGLGNSRDTVRRLLDPESSKDVHQIWGWNGEGEFNGIFTDLGVPNLWYMMGNLALCRFYSKHMALQIKAIEEGILERGTKSETKMVVLEIDFCPCNRSRNGSITLPI